MCHTFALRVTHQTLHSCQHLVLAALFIVGLVLTLAINPASAQRHKTSALAAMPELFTANAIHHTMLTSIVTNEPLLRDMRHHPFLQEDHNVNTTAPYACKNDTVFVCYDYRRGQSVVPFTRLFLPDLPGMKKEGMTIKRDKILVRYSF